MPASALRAQIPATVPTVELTPGMVITSSVRVQPKVYRLAPRPGDSAVIIIRGDGITVDFTGAELQGTHPSLDPDRAAGVGIRIEGGSRVRVRNARVRGYKVGLIARGTRGLYLEDNDFSHNWKARLFSVVEHESLVDWMSHHRNDADEWLRFGAGVYLSDVKGGEIRGNRIEQGMEGLMLVRTDSLLVWNNTIRFNSGVGIGMYRSSYNRIMHNIASFNVRGFSRYYRRGQDSADLLMYEQTSNNIVAFNMMTHGGDGLFLWAGQSTMDTGQGGSNDNLFYANNFSYAPTNAIETTFSRNTFVGNIAGGSEYGVWAGYSYDSKFIGNTISSNRTGIAIEHGQNNEIRGNEIGGGVTGIYLWANPIEPGEWGYPKYRDTRSRGYDIWENTIDAARVGLRVGGSEDVRVTRNRFMRLDTVVVVDTSRILLAGNDTSMMRVSGHMARIVAPFTNGSPAGLPEPMDRGATYGAYYPKRFGDIESRAGRTLLDTSLFQTRDAIIVDEWGPYSWKYPRLWPVDSARGSSVRLRVLGPAGMWRLVSLDGIASVSKDSGAVVEGAMFLDDTITVTPSRGYEYNWEITLEYVGEATESPRGEKRAAGVPYRFTFARYEPVMQWGVNFFAWPDSADPRTSPDAFSAVLRAPALLWRTEPRLDYMWYSPPFKGLPQTKWAAVATSTVTVPPGEHTLRTISDDGIRVYVDGVRVIDNWTKHESEVNSVPIAPGRHSIRVEYSQVDGWSELKVEVVRGRQTSTGSPGPH
ncbi:MAG TPA: NosD domain-containing protein [Longimicrobiales bacterium]